MLKKIIVSIVVLLIAGLATVYFVRNTLVEKAVETGSEYALGVKTDLGSASLDIGGGSLELNNLDISNPDGFTGQKFLTVRRGALDVETGSVLDDEVKVDSFVIEGVTLNFEQIGDKGNYKVLMDNIKRLDTSSSGESKKYRIGLIALRDINVTGSIDVMGEKIEKTFKLDNFSLRDVGGAGGADIGEVTAKVVKTLISKALAAGRNQLPGGFGDNLDKLKDQSIEKAKTGAMEKLKDLGKSLTGENK